MNRIKLLTILLLLYFGSAYSQLNMDEALRKGGWSGGIAGWVGWENYKTNINLGDNSENAKADGFNFIFSSRNGSLVETNGVFGFDFQWREKTRTIKPDPNPQDVSDYSKEKTWFLGLWARYYMPLGGNFALFIEGSGGYAVFDQEQRFDSPTLQSSESFANGFAYNGGVGFSNFVTPNVAFEITGRYEGGSLNGDTQNDSNVKSDLNIKLSNIFILFGFQVYLR
jgi:hypothetical protein